MPTSTPASRPISAFAPPPLKKSRLNIQAVLITIVVLYLGLVLVIPTANVFYQAFSRGVEPFINNWSSRPFQNALRLSLITVAIAVPLNTLFGLCAAWVIARHRFFGRTLLLSLIDLPFSISPVVAGLMIILLYGRNGWLGPWLNEQDIQIIFALPAMVLATIFVTLPFVAREVIPVLEEIGFDEEQAAKTLGASPWQAFWRVTLPNIRWGLLYGVLLTNARALGEFGAVLVVSGNIVGKTQTLPLFVEEAYVQYHTKSDLYNSVIE